MRMAMRAQTNGGIFYLLPNIAVRLVHLIPLLFLWSVLSRSGVETGMTLKQMLSYTYLNAILADYWWCKPLHRAGAMKGSYTGSISARPLFLAGSWRKR